jgi:hypothetical protein
MLGPFCTFMFELSYYCSIHFFLTSHYFKHYYSILFIGWQKTTSIKYTLFISVLETLTSMYHLPGYYCGIAFTI